jgi:hypothetical protein
VMDPESYQLIHMIENQKNSTPNIEVH